MKKLFENVFEDMFSRQPSEIAGTDYLFDGRSFSAFKNQNQEESLLTKGAVFFMSKRYIPFMDQRAISLIL